MSDLQIEVLGIIAISVMVICYALEQVHSWFIALFAIACCFAAIYAYLIGSYPFMLAEGIWAFVAAKRWRDSKSSSPG